MEILKARIITDGAHCEVDAIDYEGAFWLVPEWLDNRAEGYSAPLRIICLDGLAHHRLPEGLLVELPMPKYLFDLDVPIPEDTPYEVVDRPDIQVRDSQGMN